MSRRGSVYFRVAIESAFADLGKYTKVEKGSIKRRDASLLHHSQESERMRRLLREEVTNSELMAY